MHGRRGRTQQGSLPSAQTLEHAPASGRLEHSRGGLCTVQCSHRRPPPRHRLYHRDVIVLSLFQC